ncbi:MAG TPA: MFS transporter [Actinomycetota bacterium]|nr:MFS transporter [Actinomycetota bacterium]
MSETAAGPTAPSRGAGGSVDRTFRSLRVRNFRLFLTGQLLSGIGTWMQWTAAPWLVLQLTHSGVALGVDTALGALPILLFGAWGGVLADRFDNRKVLVWTQSLYAVLAFALFALDASGVVRVWHVYVLSFLTGMVGAVDMPTRQTFYLEMVGPDELTNAMSLNTATFTGSRIVGPAIAGIMIGVVGTAPVFLVNGVTYLAVVVALAAMRVGELHPRELVAKARGQVREAVRYVWRTSSLRLPLILMTLVFMLSFNFQVLVPLLAERTFEGDAGTFAGLLALLGLGSLAGALVMAARSSRSNVGRLAGAAIALGGTSLLLAAAPTLPAAWLATPFAGAAGTAFAITANSTLQLNASPAFRGRVMALYTVVFIGSTPVGGPISGWVGEHVDPRVALAGGAVIAIVAGLMTLSAMWRESARVSRPA